MPTINSPLRYPGGKAVLSDFLAGVIQANGLSDGIYAEPFAGGAGAALNLLFSGHVDKILLNDADPCIFAFWSAVLKQTKGFLELLKKTPVSIDEWRRQREIYCNPSRHSNIKVGFATFFLNRCNRSGILMKAGPIGGYEQTGTWKIDARYNSHEQKRRIEKIALFKDKITIFNYDAIDFIKKEIFPLKEQRRILVYLDPPYYVKGSKLYLNHFVHRDHAALARFIKKKHDFYWVMSYDNVPEIRELYLDKEQVEFDLNYSAHTAKTGSELLVYDSTTLVPLESKLIKIAT